MTDYGNALRNLDDIAAKVHGSDLKYGELRQSIQHHLQKSGGENIHAISGQMDQLNDLYAKRRHTLAQLRYALHYRQALQKAGVNPEDVVQRFSSKIEKFGKPRRVQMTEVELKDGRRVKIEPFDIPNELLKW